MNEQSKEQVAARLKAARKRIFGTATEAADALGMNPVTVRAHESGRNGVSYYDLERYARRYGVAQMWLLTGKGKEEPSTDFTSELGELIYVEAVIDDEAWYPAEVGLDSYSRTAEGYAERVAYTDPRYPEGMVGAFKVRTKSTDKTYIDGTIVFCVDITEFAVRPGDHVLLIRTRGDFDNISVRVVDEQDGAFVFRSLSSDSPPVFWEATEKEEMPHISALIVGSLVRRPAPAVTSEQIRRWEGYRAQRERKIAQENAEIVRTHMKEHPELYRGEVFSGTDDTKDIAMD